MIDTGSSISVLPSEFKADFSDCVTCRTASGELIETLGSRSLNFTLGASKRTYVWKFHVANVSHPIIGMDFLAAHNFIIKCDSQEVFDMSNGGTENFSDINKLSKHIHISSLKTDSDVVAYKCPDEHITFTHTLISSRSNLTKRSAEPTTKLHQHFHAIVTQDTFPLRERVRPLSSDKLEAVKQEFLTLEASGVIRRSSSPWAAPLHVVTKKDGTFRPCGDFRRLNEITVHDSYPMPLIGDALSRLNKAVIFSTLDLAKAYHQIPVLPSDVPKTAVITPFGLFEYISMPFGLRNAAQTFQRYIDSLLSKTHFAIAYIDDLVIGSASVEEHHTHITHVLDILNQHNLQLNLSKCNFFQTEVQFLGHLISKDGIRPLPSRLSTIRDFPRPKTVTELRSFIGTVNYCHRFIPKISEIVSPLSALTNKPKKSIIPWDNVSTQAFQTAKDSLLNIQTLSHPNITLPFTLTTDASDCAVGAVLHQINGDVRQPLEFFSKKLLPTQTRYSAFDRELLGIYLAIKHFRHLLEGRAFTIFTDHKPLLYIFTMRDPSPRQQRQITYISQFSCTIEHIHGKENAIADCLSRYSINALTHSPIFTTDILRANPPSSADLSTFTKTPTLEDGIHYDTSLPGTLRPILAQSLRLQAFHAVHDLHHPGSAATFSLLHTKVVWPSMRHDVKLWVKQCLLCQQHKITRHTKPPFIHYPTGSRFETLHLDLDGPLPPDNGFTYIMTMIDRKTRWFEAIPLRTITAEVVANTLVNDWIARYGVPHRIITDRGSQFESTLFHILSTRLNINHLRTTAYHPQCNGLIERFHRTFKTSLRILTNNSCWTKSLPFVLMGWRNTPSKTTSTSPAQLLFGTSITMPNELVELTSSSFTELDEARNHFLALDSNPEFSVSHAHKPFVPRDLRTATHVWIRKVTDTSLSPRYSGPFRLIKIENNVAFVDVDNVNQTISLTRVKPAFICHDDLRFDTNATSESENTTNIQALPLPPQNTHILNDNVTNLPSSSTSTTPETTPDVASHGDTATEQPHSDSHESSTPETFSPPPTPILRQTMTRNSRRSPQHIKWARDPHSRRLIRLRPL